MLKGLLVKAQNLVKSLFVKEAVVVVRDIDSELDFDTIINGVLADKNALRTIANATVWNESLKATRMLRTKEAIEKGIALPEYMQAEVNEIMTTVISNELSLETHEWAVAWFNKGFVQEILD